MSTHPAPDRFTVADASIHTLTEALTRQQLSGEVPASLIRIRLTDDGLEVGLRPLEGDHPAVWLTGHHEDEETDAFGVVTGGRVFSMDDPTATLGRASIGVVVSRRGEVANTSINDRGDVVSGEELTGLVVDLVRRTIGLETAPPPCDPDVLFAQAWLIDIVDFTHAEARIPSWTEIAQMHAAVAVLDPAESADLTETDLADLMRAFASWIDWRRLRTMLDSDRLDIPGLNPGEGEWFDDGSFARRLLADRPPLGHLRADIGRLLPARLGQRVVATLDAAGLPHTCWPDPMADLCQSA